MNQGGTCKREWRLFQTNMDKVAKYRVCYLINLNCTNQEFKSVTNKY